MGRRSIAGGPRFWGGAVVAVARRPRLWATAVAQARRLVRPRWWRDPPFVPAPSREYLRHRLETQYGRDHEPDPDDVVAYLEWCRQMSFLIGRPRRLGFLRRRSTKPPPSRLLRATRR